MAMNKKDVVTQILQHKNTSPQLESATSFAPSNIALVKYWGKRNQAINLPLTPSLSISLKDKGTTTRIALINAPQDSITLNKQMVHPESEFAKRLSKFLDLFRPPHTYYQIDTISSIPVAAGLASSASGFAAIVKALDQFYGWNLAQQELSILSRLGSGSACRSLWDGFVEWQQGEQEDGMDSYGVPIHQIWPELCLGLLIFTEQEKSIGSREAMQRTVETSSLFQSWPKQVTKDLASAKAAIYKLDFQLLGQTAEHNALSMHATMLSSWPPIIYSNQATLAAMQKVWQLRKDGISVYFTQDAGPNLKLLFLHTDLAQIQSAFPCIQVIKPFQG